MSGIATSDNDQCEAQSELSISVDEEQNESLDSLPGEYVYNYYNNTTFHSTDRVL